MIALALCAFAYGAVGQTAAMPTIQVVQFTKLERQLNSAVASGDQQVAASLLTTDFAEWTPQPPGAPISRDEWLHPPKRNRLGRATPARIEQMAVKQIDDHALVDFVLTSGSKQFFIVDLWLKEGATWKLQQRYRSEINKAAYHGSAPLPPRKY